jgi:hypothetical protein
MTRESLGRHTFLATDDPVGFQLVGTRFLGLPLERVELVDITP